MNHPEQDIAAVVELLVAAVSPDIQQAAFQRYVTADASFRHPLCKVDTGVKSRDNILAVYQWVYFLLFYVSLKWKIGSFVGGIGS
jgi:hypothetical protein